jgi:ubiquinone/menaquinone biosynthesis C-methylase UbiE
MWHRFLLVLMHYVPWLKRRLWKDVYQKLAGCDTADWRFMNYGYCPVTSDAPPLELDSNDEPDRYAIQLYHRIAAAVPVKGKDVLEVGSGRGGGASFVARYHMPAKMTGVDYSDRAVELANRLHRVEGLTFVQGDAEALPFAADSFDVVINVESSHCYGSMEKFLKEVRRVLRPGGQFSFADVRWHTHRMELHSQMIDSGLTLIEYEEITPGVLESMRRDSDRKAGLTESYVGKSLKPLLSRLWGEEGTDIYASFFNGSLIYLRYLLKKPASQSV